jgi:hypothetical protein
MRRMIVMSVFCLLATVLLAGGKVTPLHVKTGLWESTSTTTLNGALGIPPELLAQMTPEQKARYEAAMKRMANGRPTSRTYRNCLTEKELKENPFPDKEQTEGMQCKQEVIRSTGSDLEVRETCSEGTTSGEAHMTFHASSSEHTTGQGEMTATMGGRTMHSKIKIESKWLGASCPKGVE